MLSNFFLLVSMAFATYEVASQNAPTAGSSNLRRNLFSKPGKGYSNSSNYWGSKNYGKSGKDTSGKSNYWGSKNYGKSGKDTSGKSNYWGSKNNGKSGKSGKDTPGPTPFPPSGGDSWDQYQVAGMDVMSVTGGKNKSNYDKVVIMLHGGGASGSEFLYNYQSGWFGDLTGLKYVFPTSAIASGVWYNSYKNGCGLADDCGYDIPSIRGSASRVATLIEHEKTSVGGDNSKVYLAGFSQGAQLTGYMQLAHLNFALGGVVVMDGFPLPPLGHMPEQNSADAKKSATYYGKDMRWMIYHGAADTIFPANYTLTTWNGIFDVLDARSTLKIEHVEPGMYHTLIKPEFDQMVEFIRS